MHHTTHILHFNFTGKSVTSQSAPESSPAIEAVQTPDPDELQPSSTTVPTSMLNTKSSSSSEDQALPTPELEPSPTTAADLEAPPTTKQTLDNSDEELEELQEADPAKIETLQHEEL